MSEAVTRDPAGSESAVGADGSSSAGGATRFAPEDTGGLRPTGQWPRSRIYRVAARGVLVLAVLCSLMGGSIIAACFVNDFNINQSPGQGVAEVINTTSPLRTVVRFHTEDGRTYLPASGVLYPQGLRKGQMVRIEYDQRNPDLARVMGRNGWLAVQPVATAVAASWAVLLSVRWVLLRTQRRYADAEARS